MTIHVLGSLNMDLVRLPQPGETVLGDTFTQVPGGKGANQAMAAARLGANTRLVGRVGQDSFGDDLLASLDQGGVDLSAVTRDAASPTGIAAIAVTPQQNQIIVIPGANGQVNGAEVNRLGTHLAPQDALLLQLEIPLAAVTAAAQLGHQHQVRVILDPAPAPATLSPDLLASLDILTPNQTEAAQLVGFPVKDIPSAKAAARQLRQQVPTVMIKLGALGVWVDSSAEAFHQNAFPVPVVDTVAAGDAFNGGLAVALSEGMSLRVAAAFASATAAISVGRPGAQPSLPTRLEVEKLLQS